MSLCIGDQVEYVGEPEWFRPDEGSWLRPGDVGTIIDFEPPDLPIVSFGECGTIVVGREDVRAIPHGPGSAR